MESQMDIDVVKLLRETDMVEMIRFCSKLRTDFKIKTEPAIEWSNGCISTMLGLKKLAA